MKGYAPALDGILTHGKNCRCQTCITRNANATMFPATRGPWDMEADNGIRNAHFVDDRRYGNSAREDLRELFQLDLVVGHEASDYQNPYAFAATGVLDYPSPFGTSLAPGTYGLGDGGQAEADVAINIRATQNVIMRG